MTDIQILLIGIASVLVLAAYVFLCERVRS